MANNRPTPDRAVVEELPKEAVDVGNGDVLIAAITSCTNTSNPSVMLAAGLLARKAVERGLTVSPRVKTSLAPGSRVVTEYLQRTGLQPYLDRLGFGLVGYGCTTCIGNSGPLDGGLEETVNKNDLVTAAVLSGNRNFEARIHQSIKANFLMSPPLVVAFAIAGRVDIDMTKEALGRGPRRQPRLPARHLAVRGRGRAGAPLVGRRRDVPAALRGPGERESPLARDPRRHRPLVHVGPAIHLHPGAPVLLRLLAEAAAADRRARCPGARDLRRLGHDGSHQPRRRDQAHVAGGQVPRGPRRRAGRLQQLRLAPRQRPRDDARHVRERAHPQPHGGRRRGRGHEAPARRRGAVRSTTRR